MTVAKAIKAIGHKATSARNPIEYLEKVATDKWFKDFTKLAKKYQPNHALWKNRELKSYRFTDLTVTTINGKIIAVKPTN